VKKLLLTFIALSASAFAATTTVAQNLIGPDGLPASGSVTIRSTFPCQSGSDYVGTKSVTYRFTGGAFSIALVPNDTCVPSTSYFVTWNITGDQPRTETWFVPTSGSAVTIASVVTYPPPPISVPIQWTQMAANSLANGLYCPQVVNNKVVGIALCSTSGSSGGIDPNATWAQIEAGTAGSGSVTLSMTWAQIEAQ
jgi:hypothetical protein